MSHKESNTDDLFLNDFHRECYESWLAHRERIKSMRFTAEFLRAQSQRLEKQWREMEREERLRNSKKNCSGDGL